MPNRVLIVGAGAVGGYLGGRLIPAGREVTFLVRPGRADALRRRGLRLVSGAGTETVTPSLVTADALDQTFDLVLITVKATAIEPAIADVRPAVGPGTLVVPFLNGLAHFAHLDAAFGAGAVLGGVIKVGAALDDDGDVRVLTPGATVVLGARDPATPSDAVQAVAATLGVDGVDVTVSVRIDADLWSKWAFIAGIGAANTLLGGSAGDIAAVPDGTALATRIIEEAAAVSAAAGYPVDPTPIAAPFTDPASPLTSSLYRDAVAGNPTEVDALLGDLVARARECDLDVPLLRAATARLRVARAVTEHSATPR